MIELFGFWSALTLLVLPMTLVMLSFLFDLGIKYLQSASEGKVNLKNALDEKILNKIMIDENGKTPDFWVFVVFAMILQCVVTIVAMAVKGTATVVAFYSAIALAVASPAGWVTVIFGGAYFAHSALKKFFRMVFSVKEKIDKM